MVKKKVATININTCESKDSKCCGHTSMHCNAGGAVYGLGFIGAAIYYISTAPGFWMGVLGFLKALIWPAFLIFELMKYLKM
jgi:hypothetical protein